MLAFSCLTSSTTKSSQCSRRRGPPSGRRYWRASSPSSPRHVLLGKVHQEDDRRHVEALHRHHGARRPLHHPQGRALDAQRHELDHLVRLLEKVLLEVVILGEQPSSRITMRFLRMVHGAWWRPAAAPAPAAAAPPRRQSRHQGSPAPRSPGRHRS